MVTGRAPRILAALGASLVIAASSSCAVPMAGAGGSDPQSEDELGPTATELHSNAVLYVSQRRNLVAPSTRPPLLTTFHPMNFRDDLTEIVFQQRTRNIIVCLREQVANSSCQSETMTVVRSESHGDRVLEVAFQTATPEETAKLDTTNTVEQNDIIDRFWKEVPIEISVAPQWIVALSEKEN